MISLNASVSAVILSLGEDDVFSTSDAIKPNLFFF